MNDSIPNNYLSTEVTIEDLKNRVGKTCYKGEKGSDIAYYSKDGNKLLECELNYALFETDSFCIEKGVKVICDYAFYNCCREPESSFDPEIDDPDYFWPDLRKIIIPDSVVQIGKSAFKGCNMLETIVIPDSVVSIGDEAFSDCGALKEIIIPDSVTSIGDGVFENCVSLKTMALPDTIERVGKGLFTDCFNLKEIVIPDSIKNIDKDAFYGCRSLNNCVLNSHFVIFENMLIDIDKGKLLTSWGTAEKVSIPDVVTTIEDEAFYGSRIRFITIPNSITCIGSESFSDSSLRQITIPESVKNIGVGSFEGCRYLERIIIPKGSGERFRKMLDEDLWDQLVEETLNSSDNDKFVVLYSKDGKKLLKCLDKKTTECSIRDNTKVICEKAFLGCESLRHISIPNSVERIEYRAFSECNSLQQIMIPDSVEHISNSAFYHCDSLEKVLIPESVKTLGSWVFAYCNSLEQIIIPNSIVEIPGRVFFKCKSLKQIRIPDSVSRIGKTALQKCPSLQRIIIPKGSKEKFMKMLDKELWDKLVEE